MKIKVYRSKISNKRFEKFAFPRYSRKELDKKQSDGLTPSIMKATLERASVTYTEPAVVVYYTIKKFKEIANRMRSKSEKFGRCLNKLTDAKCK